MAKRKKKLKRKDPLVAGNPPQIASNQPQVEAEGHQVEGGFSPLLTVFFGLVVGAVLAVIALA